MFQTKERQNKKLLILIGKIFYLYYYILNVNSDPTNLLLAHIYNPQLHSMHANELFTGEPFGTNQDL